MWIAAGAKHPAALPTPIYTNFTSTRHQMNSKDTKVENLVNACGGCVINNIILGKFKVLLINVS